MFCQNCGKELPDDTKFCQYCGWQNQNIINSNNESKISSQTKETNDGCKGCLLTGVSIFVFIFIVLMIIPETPIQSDPYAQKLLARTLCQQEIQTRLKNPKSAQFNRDEEVIERIGNMTYKIESSLYAQNSFGAEVKNYYSCKVKINDKDSGNVYDVKIQ